MSQVRLERSEELAADTPLLEVKNLSVTFSKEFGFLGSKKRETKAVNKVSFDLFQAETLSLVGESGSGKTTIARCVTALAKQYLGSIKYNGVDVTNWHGRKLLEYRKKVQIAFQDPFGSLDPFQDVLSTVSMPIKRLLGEKDESKVLSEATSLIEEVGLLPSEVLHKLPHQMSGGERQRVNIARALASRPTILVADEPVSMLDASQRLNLLLLLKKLQETRKIAILMITHDLATSKVMGGKTAVMYLGKLFEIAPTSELLVKPRHPYTELLINAAPRMNFKSETTELYGATIEKSEGVSGGCIFRNRCKYATSICEQVEPPLERKTPESRSVACHNWLNKP